MSIVHRCCAALDVHKESVTVCVRTGVSRREHTLETAQFGTFTEDLEKLAEWLQQRKSDTWRWRARACTGSRCGMCWS